MTAVGGNSSPRIRAVAYVRISTLVHGQSLQNQIVPIRSFAEARGYELIEVFQDEGISGAKAKERRPGLERLCRAVNEGNVQIVIIAALDRLFRDTRHMLNLCAEWSDLGVQLVSIRENLDFSTPVGQMTLAVISAAATLEKNIISERIRQSLAVKKLAAKQSGSSWRSGRPDVLSAEKRKQIEELRAAGLSIRRIAAITRISKTSVLRAIKTERGTG